MNIDDLPEWFRQRGEPAYAAEEALDTVVRSMLSATDRGMVVVDGSLPDRAVGVEWPWVDDSSVRSFLDAAEQAGARLLLLSVHDLTDVSAAAQRSLQAINEAIDLTEAGETEELERLVVDLERVVATSELRTSEIGSLTAGWSADGVGVQLVAQCAWFRDALTTALEGQAVEEELPGADEDDEAYIGRRPFEPPADDAERAVVVAEIGASREFALAKNFSARWTCAEEASSRFSSWIEEDPDAHWELQRWMQDVIRDAQDIAERVTFPLIENDWAQEAHRMLAAGEKKQVVAARLNLSYSKFTAALARHPYDPDWSAPGKA